MLKYIKKKFHVKILCCCTQTNCSIFMKSFKSYMHMIYIKNIKFGFPSIIWVALIIDSKTHTHTHMHLERETVHTKTNSYNCNFQVQETSKCVILSKTRFWMFHPKTIVSLPYIGWKKIKRCIVINMFLKKFSIFLNFE